MNKKLRFTTLLLVTSIYLFSSIQVFSQTLTTPTASPAFTNSSLKELPIENWLTNGGNVYNQRYSPLTDINRENVEDLNGVWHMDLGSGLDQRYSGEAQPLVYDGVIYVITGADDVFAISVDTGAILWKYEAGLNPDIDTICCGWTSRGVGMGDGKIFVGQLDGKLLALDQKTGDISWSIQAEKWEEGYSITSAPLYYNGLVITGFAGAEYATRGRVKAYDANDGSLVWTFYTVPGPGEFGHDTWSQENDVWKYGGGTVWQTPAIDPDLGLIYFSTGNPGPDFNGSVRPGDNLFTASVVAVDVMTGKYRWHYQQVHHDIWDYDAPTPVILFDMERDGKSEKAIVATNKTGWAYILDRETGEPLIGIQEKPVLRDERQLTSPTQPYPVGDAFVPQQIDIAPRGFELVNDGKIFTPFWQTPLALKPGARGASNWPPSSYDPTSNLLYICSSDTIGAFVSAEVGDGETEAGTFYIGGKFGSSEIPNLGIFTAMDMRTNKIVWQQRWADTCYSGSITTAGKLVFVGRNDGNLMALNSDNGKQLWEFQTGAGMNSTVSTFEYKGEQYIVAYAAGNVFAGSTRGDELWLFSLNGEIEEGLPPGSSLITNANADHSNRVADLESGREVYVSTCTFCHGDTGAGGQNGPTLRNLDDSNLTQLVIQQGRNQMPPFAGILSADKIQDVSAYIISELNK